MKTIGLISYGSGNFRSVWNSLKHLDLPVKEITKPQELGDVSHIILPGVGAFGALMSRLNELQFIDELKEQVLQHRKPYLGICVGMQILAEFGTEFQKTAGLNLLGGICQEIDAKKHALRLPHVGWNEVTFQKGHPLFKDLPSPATFYFVHSFHVVPKVESDVIGYCEYGIRVTACVGRENIMGVQFHPEKSQNDGLQVLKNFYTNT